MLLFLHNPCYNITIDFLKKLNQTVVVYYLRKRPGKTGRKVKEHDFLGRSSGKFPGATEHLKR